MWLWRRVLVLEEDGMFGGGFMKRERGRERYGECRGEFKGEVGERWVIGEESVGERLWEKVGRGGERLGEMGRGGQRWGRG